jgi:RNA polymerase sigma-70 factor (ECF subfamily)
MPDIAEEVAIRGAVARLPRRQRAVLILRYFGDLSIRETADTLQLPEGTVKTLSRTAIERLRRDSRLDLEVSADVGRH